MNVGLTLSFLALSAAVGAAGMAAAGPSAATSPAAPAAKPIVGGAVEGEFVFEKCATCHLPTGSSATGPDLTGIVNRRAGSLQDFAYSAGMKSAAANGVTWDEATLDRFLANPPGVIPGTKMDMKPLADPQDRADVIAYLKSMPR